MSGLTSSMKSWVIACAITGFGCAPAVAQWPGGGLSNLDRMLLLRLGTGRYNNRAFQRYFFAASALEDVQRPTASDLYRQRNARSLALENQRRIAGALRPGTPAFASDAMTPAQAQHAAQGYSDVTLVWNTFGLSFGPADPAVVRAAAPRYTGGLVVAAIAVGGPADRAGWRSGDILLGLYKYRTMSYADIAYIAALPELAKIAPLKAILIRDGTLITSELAANTGDGPVGSEESELVDPANDRGSPAADDTVGALVWTQLGIRGKPERLTGVERYTVGVRITEVRPGSAAERAGWKTGDVLLGLAGFQMGSLDDIDYVLTEPTVDRAKPIETRLLVDSKVENGILELASPPRSK